MTESSPPTPHGAPSSRLKSTVGRRRAENGETVDRTSRLKGSLVKRMGDIAADATVDSTVPPDTLSRLRSTLHPMHEEETPEPASLFPEGYRVSEEAAEIITRRIERMREKSIAPYTDPDGVMVPGALFTKSGDPENRRLILYAGRNDRGRDMLVVHVEGMRVAETILPEGFKQKLDEGILQPIPPPAE